MELYKQILWTALQKEEYQQNLPGIAINAAEIIQLECYKALKKIKEIIEDESLEDPECFIKIEEIVYLFDTMGINDSDRHDFG